MTNDLVPQESMTPGFGMAGQVICPFMSVARLQPCLKSACELWTELTYAAGTPDERKVARCALTWMPTIAAEQTQALNRLTKAMTALDETNAPPA